MFWYELCFWCHISALNRRTFLVAQWMRTRLPMWGRGFEPGAGGLRVPGRSWGHAPPTRSPTAWGLGPGPQLLRPTHPRAAAGEGDTVRALTPPQSSPHLPHRRRPTHRSEDPPQAELQKWIQTLKENKLNPRSQSLQSLLKVCGLLTFI